MRSALPPAALALARAEFALPNPELRSRGRRRTGTPAGGSVGLTYGASDTSASGARCRVWRDAARAEHDAIAERSRTALRQAAAAAAPRELGAETAVGAGARVGGRADVRRRCERRVRRGSRVALPGCFRVSGLRSPQARTSLALAHLLARPCSRRSCRAPAALPPPRGWRRSLPAAALRTANAVACC